MIWTQCGHQRKPTSKIKQDQSEPERDMPVERMSKAKVAELREGITMITDLIPQSEELLYKIFEVFVRHEDPEWPNLCS